MRAVIRDSEKDADKPITWELFRLSAAGLEPFEEG